MRARSAERLAAALLVAGAAALACGPGDTVDAGAAVDAGAEADAGAAVDAGAAGADAGPAVDAGEGEAAPGFGAVTGPCHALDDELTSPQPFFLDDHVIDFGADPYDDADLSRLTAGAQEIIADGNAGGSSVVSEAIAFDVLARCEGAVLIKTETEIDYTVASTKITDFTVDMDGVVIGVNPVRTFVFPAGTPLTFDEATRRLQGKLDDVLISSANVAPADAWVKQIILVIAPEQEHVQIVRDAWDALDDETRHDSIVYVLVTDGDDAFIVD